MPNQVMNALVARGFPNAAPTFDVFDAQAKANALAKQRLDLEAQPEERNWLRKARGMKVEEFGMQKEKFRQEQEDLPFKREDEALSHILEWGPKITMQNYPDARAKWIKRGVNPSYLPPVEMFSDEDTFEAWKQQGLTSMKTQLEQVKLSNERRKINAEQRPYKIGQEITRKEGADTVTYRITGYSDAGVPLTEKVATGSQSESAGDIKSWLSPNGKIVNLKKGEMPPQGSVPYQGKGFEVQFDESGKVKSISQGGMPGTSTGMTKPTETKIQEKLFNAKEQMVRIDSIDADYKDEYQEMGTRLGNAWTSVKASLGKNVSEQDRQSLTSFATYKRKAIENINMYIKEITGAQMSEQEAGRIRQAMPDPGEHWWNGDDPITFRAKLQDVKRMTKLAVARYTNYLKNGMSPEQAKALVSSGKADQLEEIPAIMNKRLQKIRGTLANTDLSEEDRNSAAREQLKEEFGI